MASAPARTRLSPGRLYAVLNDEFRKIRSPDCRRCFLPAVELRAPGDEHSPNWVIRASTDLCVACDEARVHVARKYGPLLELVDLTAPRGAPDERDVIEGYALDARVDFLEPGLFRVKARAMSPAGNQVFALTAEVESRERALEQKQRLLRELEEVLRAAANGATRRREA